MRVYLVGGAVRDQLLGYPIKEKDWVVVGATSALMKQLGYQQVGRDFPVFLHPITKEEYALARTERKSAPGYTGFTCDAKPSVTLEEDLLRRDLTINAMAMDEKGQLIDPFHGQEDLNAKILRHVSPAFMEDPVRVLRIARFAARYSHLGFRLAEETRSLMYAMVRRHELNYLVPERVWQEWQRSLSEKNPEVFITTLRSCGALAVVLPEIDALFGVPNSKIYHPEIDSGIHSLMVLQQSVTLTDDPTIRFAALVHDLGKARTPIKEWPKHHGHEERGIKQIERLCERLRIPSEYCKLAITVSRYHLMIHSLNELKASTAVKLLEQVDAFRRPTLFDKLLTACEADAKGVGKERAYPQAHLWRQLFAECAKVSAQPFIQQGLEGQAIKTALHNQRVACAKKLVNTWKQNEK